MKAKLSIVLGSILGALALHTVLVACGSGRSSSGSSGGGSTGTMAVPDAAAQTPSTCKVWKTAFVLYPVKITGGEVSSLPQNQAVGEATLPAGWEPIGADPGYGITNGGQDTLGVLTTVRQCVSQ